MGYKRRIMATLALPVVVAVNVGVTTSTASAAGTWAQVSSVDPGISPRTLASVATVAPNDVWAVGRYAVTDLAGNWSSRTLGEHWDGVQWRVSPTADIAVVHPAFPGETLDELHAVSTVSSNDVWAVGTAVRDLNPSSTSAVGAALIEHWNGRSWSVVANPTTGNVDTLNAVAAISASDVWAVGSADLVEHWDGHVWTIVPGGLGQTATLSGVSAASSADVWAVGHAVDASHCTFPVSEHWDGHVWSAVAIPRPADNICRALYAVTVVAANNVWAVGSPNLVEHWDGTNWNTTTVPNTYDLRNFRGVSALGANDVWAVASDTIHWDGSTWQAVTAPKGPSTRGLNAVASLPNHTLWAVGETGDYSGVPQIRTLIVRNTAG